MRRSNIKAVYIKNMFLLLFFGILVSAISTYIYYTMQHNKTEQKVAHEALLLSTKVKSDVQTYLNRVDNSIDSIRTNNLFRNYLLTQSKLSKYNATELFINTMKNNQNFFQLRFIDKKGMEKIRIDRLRPNNTIVTIHQDKLQDKSKRYYFKDAITKPAHTYWHSSLDLNIENKKLEKPIRPTLRVATNVYYKGKHYGILIVNLEMKNLLADIKHNNSFNTYLIDKDGYYIVNPNKQNDWSRYFNPSHTIYTDFSNLTKEQVLANNFGEHGMLYPLEKYFKNGDNIQLALQTKDAFLHNLEVHNMKFALSIGLIILLISIPLGFFLSIPISKLYLDFNKLYKDNKRHLEIIDKYVFSMDVDLDKKITYVSSAQCKNSGYTKKELIGATPSIFKSNTLDATIYKDLWQTIESGSIWHGELLNKRKNGELYWIDITILPNYNEANKIDSYTSVAKDITDKKTIEIISKTDKLTQIFNRVELDDCLVNEFNRYSRTQHIFSVIIIDIDHFKAVNDKYGHQVGDSVLVELSNILKVKSRKTDIVGRWGGEEFMIICIDTDIQGAAILAENLRKEIEKFEFNIVKHKTVSIGVSEIKDTDTMQSLIKRADDYLYKAKENGRNNVVSDILS